VAKSKIKTVKYIYRYACLYRKMTWRQGYRWHLNCCVCYLYLTANTTFNKMACLRRAPRESTAAIVSTPATEAASSSVLTTDVMNVVVSFATQKPQDWRPSVSYSSCRRHYCYNCNGKLTNCMWWAHMCGAGELKGVVLVEESFEAVHRATESLISVFYVQNVTESCWQILDANFT
jgi:hypothetical protein